MKRLLAVFVMVVILIGACALAEENTFLDLGCTPEDIVKALDLEDDGYSSHVLRFYNDGDELYSYEGLVDIGISSTFPLCPGTMYQDGIRFDYALSTDVRSRNVKMFIFTYEVPDGIEDATAAIETGLVYWNRVIETCSEEVQESYIKARMAFEVGLSGGYGSDYMREYYAEGCAFACMADGKRICYAVTSFTSETDINWIEYEVDDQSLQEFIEEFQKQSEFADEAEVRLWPNEEYYTFCLAPVSRVSCITPDNQRGVSIWFYGSEMEAIKYTQTTMQDYYFPPQVPDGLEFFQYRYKNMSIQGYCAEVEEQIDIFRAAVLAWEKIFGNA